jgi:ankyrin repeat protein
MLSKFKNQRLLDESWVIQSINELMSDNLTKGSKLKKLSGFVEPVYSIRGTLKARLVFTYGIYQGELSIFLLDILPNHDIPKNNTYDDQVRMVHKMMFGEALPLEEPDTKAILSAITTVEPTPVYEFNRSGFILTEDQNNLIKIKTDLPLLVNGPPGSGKTSTLFIMLSELSEQNETGLPKKYLYIARSKALANFMREEWHKSGYAQRAQEKNSVVEFKYAQCSTYQEVDEHFFYYPVVDKIKLELAKNTLATIPLTLSMTVIKAWFDKKLNELRKRHDAHKNIQIDLESFLQEKDILCGYSRKTYLADAFGKRNSLFEPSQKSIVYDLYEQYCEFVTHQTRDKQLLDLNLCSINADIGKENLYDIILVDETQDFSLGQLHDLKQLSVNNQIIMSIDSNQDLEKGLSLRTHIKGLFTVDGTCYIKSLFLVKSFRCPELIIELANCLIALKNKITGGVIDKDEYSSFQQQSLFKEKGEVLLVSSQSLQQSKELLSRFKDTEIVVVAYADKKEEAQKLFPNYTVFTPEEIKGLEFKCVITYQLFDTTLFKEANKLLKNTPEKANINRAKSGEARPLFAPGFNGVFTSFTRAQNALVIVEDGLNELSHLIAPLKEIVDKANQKSPLNTNNNTNTAKQPVKTTVEDWKKQVDDLVYQGKNEMAEAVFNQRLKAPLLLSFEEYQKKDNLPQSKTPVQNTLKKSYPKTKERKNVQNENNNTIQSVTPKKQLQSLQPVHEQKSPKKQNNKPTPQAQPETNKLDQSLRSINEKKSRELLISKPSYLLNHFSEMFLEIFLNHENLPLYRTLALPQFNNQTFLDAILSDRDKRQILEQLLAKKPLLIQKFLSDKEMVRINGFATGQRYSRYMDKIIIGKSIAILQSVLNQFNCPGFIINHMVTPTDETLVSVILGAGYEECVDFLLNIDGFDVNKEINCSGHTPLIYAINDQNVKLVNSLLGIKGIDVNKSDKLGFTPLLSAIGCNNIEIVQKLLKNNLIDVNKSISNALSPLGMSAGSEERIAITNTLLNTKGIDLEDLTPLWIAVEMGLKETVKVLLNFLDINDEVLDSMIKFNTKCGPNKDISALLQNAKKNQADTDDTLVKQGSNEGGYSAHFFKQNTIEKEVITDMPSQQYTSNNNNK